MAEQEWELTIGAGAAARTERFLSPSSHTAGNMARAEAGGRKYILHAICPHCDKPVEASDAKADDGRWCHVACLRKAVRS